MGVATLRDFTGYGNGIHGVELSVVGHVRLADFKIADNVENGIEIQETHGDWGGPMIVVRLIDTAGTVIVVVLHCNSSSSTL